MKNKLTKEKKQKNDYSRVTNIPHDCRVSNASTAIMLDRFCNGNGIEFPFSK